MHWVYPGLVGIAIAAAAANSSAQVPSSSGSASEAGRQEAQYHGGLVTPPLPKPSFTLTDTSGAAFDFRNSTDGYVTLLYFGFCHCTTACPTQMAFLSGAMRNLPQNVRDQIKVVFVTTDPERDNPRMIHTWLSRVDRSFIGLTGSIADIRKAETAAKMPQTIKPDEHAAFIVVYTKDDLGHVIYPVGITQADWIHDLPLLVTASWTTADSSSAHR